MSNPYGLWDIQRDQNFHLSETALNIGHTWDVTIVSSYVLYAGKIQTVPILDIVVKRFDGTETKHRESYFNLYIHKWEEGLCSAFMFTTFKALRNNHFYSQLVYNLTGYFVYLLHV